MSPQKLIFLFSLSQRHRPMSKNVGTANVKLSKAKLSEAKLSYVNLSYLNKKKTRNKNKTKNTTKTKNKAEQTTVLCTTTSRRTLFGF